MWAESIGVKKGMTGHEALILLYALLVVRWPTVAVWLPVAIYPLMPVWPPMAV